MFWKRTSPRRQPIDDFVVAGPPSSEADRGSRCVDGFIESYVQWREACDEVRTAYRRWTRSTMSRPRRGWACARYRAALDREEVAAFTFGLFAGELARLEHQGVDLGLGFPPGRDRSPLTFTGDCA